MANEITVVSGEMNLTGPEEAIAAAKTIRDMVQSESVQAQQFSVELCTTLYDIALNEKFAGAKDSTGKEISNIAEFAAAALGLEKAPQSIYGMVKAGRFYTENPERFSNIPWTTLNQVSSRKPEEICAAIDDGRLPANFKQSDAKEFIRKENEEKSPRNNGSKWYKIVYYNAWDVTNEDTIAMTVIGSGTNINQDDMDALKKSLSIGEEAHNILMSTERKLEGKDNKREFIGWTGMHFVRLVYRPLTRGEKKAVEESEKSAKIIDHSIMRAVAKFLDLGMDNGMVVRAVSALGYSETAVAKALQELTLK